MAQPTAYGCADQRDNFGLSQNLHEVITTSLCCARLARLSLMYVSHDQQEMGVG